MIKRLSKLEKTVDKKEVDLIRDIVTTLGQQVRLTKQVMETIKKTQGLMSNILDNEKKGADNTDILIKSIGDVVKMVKELKLSERVIWTMFRLVIGLILLMAFWNPLTKLAIFLWSSIISYVLEFIPLYNSASPGEKLQWRYYVPGAVILSIVSFLISKKMYKR